MKEAKIECLIREYPIHDLGLTMTQGQVEFVDKAKARQSKDLKEARRIGAVQVEFVERSRMTKKPGAPPRSPPPPNVRLKRGAHRRTPPAPAAPTIGVDMNEIRRIAREEARAGAREGTAEGVEIGVRKALEQFRGQNADTTTTAQIKEALVEVLTGLNLGVPTMATPATPTGPEEPVFIPKSIVNKSDKTQITTQTTEAEDGGISAAASALKAAKGVRKKRTRKKPSKQENSK